MAPTAAVRKRFLHLGPGSGAPAETGPMFSRGWIRLRNPARYPGETLRFLRGWWRLKREVDRWPGLLTFEYRVRRRPLLLGMHVGWSHFADELGLHDVAAHRALADWAMRSPLIVALRLEHYTWDANGRLVALGGFYSFEREDDIAEGMLCPAPPVAGQPIANEA